MRKATIENPSTKQQPEEEVTADGNRDWASYLALMDTFPFWFNIVTPADRWRQAGNVTA